MRDPHDQGDRPSGCMGHPHPGALASLYRREYHLGGIMGWFGLWFDRGMADPHGEMADETLRMMGVTLHPMMDVRRTRPGS